MILKALYDYYHRSGTLAPQGMEYKEIAFLIVIDRDGRFLRIEDTGGGRNCLVKKGVEKTSNVAADLLWGNIKYTLNLTDKVLLENINKYTLDFIDRINVLLGKYPGNATFKAVSLFYEKKEYLKIVNDPLWSVIKDSNKYVSFIIQGELFIAAEDNSITDYNNWQIDQIWQNEKHQRCLVTGNISPVARLSGSVPIFKSKSNAKLISFKEDKGYDSYGKQQCYNAPISIEAEESINTAINHLINSKNKFILGKRTFVFWALYNELPASELEDSLLALFGFEKEQDDNPNRGIEQVEKFFKSIYSGALGCSLDDKFYILGLAPSAARISVTHWSEIPLKKFANQLLKHFDDFEIVNTREVKRSYKGLYQILSAVTLKGKVSDCQPNLPEDVIKSMLQGLPYSYTLFSATISRIRAEQAITTTRAAIIKAYLNRLNDNNKKITITMDKENTNQGYLCGRLFATLEYLQKRSGAETVRSRFMNAASANPATVFANLLNLSVHHSEKLDKGSQIFFENIKTEIIAAISADGFPAHLDIQDQGRFMVGYYHQLSEFYTKSEHKNENNRED